MTSKKLITASIGTSLSQAEEILQTHKIEKLPVVDSKGKLMGLITFRDINKHSETTDPRGYKYLYYINLNDEVVEVTSVTNSKNHGTKFNDMHYVVMLKKYHKIEYK